MIDRLECADCGAPVERERATGYGAALLNRLKAQCDACAARDDAAAADTAARHAAAAAAARWRAHVQASGLPVELRGLKLAELDPTPPARAEAIAAARRWATGSSGRRGLVLTGSFGVGKTTIAAAAVMLLLRIQPARWASAIELMRCLSADFGSAERRRGIDLLSGGHALALDDLDKTRPTAYAAEQVLGAVDNAIVNRQHLLITTNLQPGPLAQSWPEPFGEAIVSRLVGYSAVHTVDGRDRRLDPPPSAAGWEVGERSTYGRAR